MRELAKQVIREHYASGGSAACLPHLPHMTGRQIRQIAKEMKIRAPKVVRKSAERIEREVQDAHRVWQRIDRTIPAANDGPLIARIAA